MESRKWITLTIFAMTMSYALADDYTPAQANFRNDINLFLKEEGYAPTVNTNTGDLNFKMEGTNYVIDLNKEFKSPYLVTLSAIFNMETPSNSDKVRLFEIENTINANFKCVKASYLEYEASCLLIFSIESFCHNSDDFKYALVRYLEFIKSAVKEFGNLYGSGEAQATNRISVNNSNILQTDSHYWELVGIELFSDRTVLTKIVRPKTSQTYVFSTKSEFIEDVETGRKYFLSSSDIGLTRFDTFLQNDEARSFTESYPALPKTVKRINVSSGTFYYIKNLKIR